MTTETTAAARPATRSTRRSNGSRTKRTRSTRGTTNASATSSSRSTTRASRRSGAASPTSTGPPTSIPRSWCASRNSPTDGLVRTAAELHGIAAREVGREGVHCARHRDVQGVAEPVHARRAGRDAHRRQARRGGAVDRRQVLRRDADDGRGAPHRGVRQVPRPQARRGVPDEPVPRAADRRAARGQPAGTSRTSACRS